MSQAAEFENILPMCLTWSQLCNEYIYFRHYRSYFWSYNQILRYVVKFFSNSIYVIRIERDKSDIFKENESAPLYWTLRFSGQIFILNAEALLKNYLYWFFTILRKIYLVRVSKD